MQGAGCFDTLFTAVVIAQYKEVCVMSHIDKIFFLMLILFSEVYCLDNWYQEKAHAFLIHMGVPNAGAVPINCVDNAESSLRLVHGAARQNGIWINSGRLALEPEWKRIFIVAHEVAHYAKNHPRQLTYAFYGLKVAELGTRAVAFGVMLYFFMCDIAQRNKAVQIVGCCAMGGLLSYAAWILQKLPFVRAMYHTYSRKLEKEADILAASMLCSQGYRAVVEEAVKQCERYVMHSVPRDEKHDMHPSYAECRDYLQAVLDDQRNMNVARK